MSGKFYVTNIGKYDTLFDNFVDAEAAAKKRAAYSENTYVMQQIASVDLPTIGAFTTVL